MGFRLGIDVGGTGIKAGVVDDAFKIIKRTSVKTPASFESAMDAVKDAAVLLADQTGIRVSDFSCVGLGVPCSIVPKTGKLVFANNTNWKGLPIISALKERFDVPVFVDNDANCAVAGETLAGAAKGKNTVVMITIGTGVGGGIIIDGKLFAGGDGLGAEIGHLNTVYNGIRCTCGTKGCFEAYASATALIRQTKRAIKTHPGSYMAQLAKEQGEVTGRTAFDCAILGDAAAIKVIDRYSSYISAGLGGLVNIFRPDLIIIGGGISNAGDMLLDRIRKGLPAYTLGYDEIGTSPVQKAVLGNDAGITGAAYLDRFQRHSAIG